MHKSASQIETFADCPRKWGWKYLDKIEGPPNRYAEFGKTTHAQIEAYLTKGQPLDLTTEHGQCAMAGSHLWPLPGTVGMQVEVEFHLHAWGHHFLGYKDIELLGSIPRVIDHKTTSDPKKWAKTPEELVTNIQGALYAADAMIKANTKACDLLWIYYRRTKPYGALPVEARVTRQDIAPTLETIRGIADQIDIARQLTTTALQLPYNANSCDKYGGCPFQRHCNLSPQERLDSFMSQAGIGTPPPIKTKEEFLATIQAAQAQAGGTAPAVNPPVPQNGAGLALPPGAQIQGDQYWAPGMSGWEKIPTAAAAPQGPPPLPAQGPPPLPVAASGPPPLPASAPPPLPVTKAPPPAGAPQISGDQYWIPGTMAWLLTPADRQIRTADGLYTWAPVGNTWIDSTSVAMPQSTPDAGKRGPGRPKGSRNKGANAAPPLPGQAPGAEVDPTEVAARALELIAEGATMLAAALRDGLLDS